MPEIKDVKPPVDMPGEFWWVWWLLAAVAIAAVALYFLSRRKPAEKAAVIVPPKLPWEIAYERLDALALKKYPEAGIYQPFYVELTGIVRHYLEDHYSIKAPEMTTEEFLNFMKKTSVLKEEHKVVLKDFLNGSDMVKFAKHEPTIGEAQANFDLARKLIAETKDGT